jgi:hypothetical protein
LGSFFRLIEDGGDKLVPASRLLEVYAREQDREMLRDFFYSDDRRVESAVLALDEASKATVCVKTCLFWILTSCTGPIGQARINENRTEVFLRR